MLLNHLTHYNGFVHTSYTLHIRFPAEWEQQSGVQLTWPHAKTDWRDSLDEVLSCFAAIAR